MSAGKSLVMKLSESIGVLRLNMKQYCLNKPVNSSRKEKQDDI